MTFWDEGLGENRLGPNSIAPVKGLATLRRGRGHYAGNLREDLRNAGGDGRHDRSGSDGHESSHQCVFNQVLAAHIFPDAQQLNRALGNPDH